MGSVLISGLSNGAVYALVAIGFTLVHKTTGVLNFAQGAFVMVGGLGTYGAMDRLGVSYPVALLIGLVVSFLLAVLIWAGIVAPLKLNGAEGYVVILATLVVAVGLGLVAQYLFGSQPHTLPPIGPDSSITVGGVSVSAQHGLVILSGLVLAGLFGLLLMKTSLGRQMRACAADSKTAELLGVSYWRVGMWSFALTALIGAIGGQLIAAVQFTSFDAGVTYGIYGFIGAMIGGFNRLLGAVVGGLVVGLTYALVASQLSSTYAPVLVLGLLLVVLWVRPHGLVREKG